MLESRLQQERKKPCPESILHFSRLIFSLHQSCYICCRFTLILDKRRRLLHRIASAWGYHFVRLNRRWKCRFENKSKFKSDKTYVVVANHQSIADTFFLSGLARPFKWVSMESLFKLPFFGWNMHLTRYISIKRGDARQTAGAAAEQPDLIMLDVHAGMGRT